jgi:hydroxyacylglutathione hydrolase
MRHEYSNNQAKRLPVTIMNHPLLLPIAFLLSLTACSANSQDYVSIKLAPGIWHIEDRADPVVRDSMYLIEGTKVAALIDTGMGKGRLDAYVRSLTKRPVLVLITHGHADHTGRAGLFSTVYFPMEDAAFKPPFDISRAMALYDGQKFDLGGRSLEAIALPGHTRGSVAFLDAEDRMLFSGDAVGSSFVWMQIKGATSLSAYLESVRRLEAQGAEFDAIYGGHFYQQDYKPLLPSYVSDMRIVVEKVLKGELVGSPYRVGPAGGFSATFGSATLVYDPNRL